MTSFLAHFEQSLLKEAESLLFGMPGLTDGLLQRKQYLGDAFFCFGLTARVVISHRSF